MIVFRYQSMTPEEAAAFRAELERDAACPACGEVAVIVEEWEQRGPREAGTLYLHEKPAPGEPPVPACWVPAEEETRG